MASHERIYGAMCCGGRLGRRASNRAQSDRRVLASARAVFTSDIARSPCWVADIDCQRSVGVSGIGRVSKFVLEGEGIGAVPEPNEVTVRDFVASLNRNGASFLTMSNARGDYVQCAGSRPWCVVERREASPANHWRAFQPTPVPKYKDGARINTGAGDIIMRSDEWFLLKDAAEIFAAFLSGTPFPDQVGWRPMNEMFEL